MLFNAMNEQLTPEMKEYNMKIATDMEVVTILLSKNKRADMIQTGFRKTVHRK